jgi:hypothetical protein
MQKAIPLNSVRPELVEGRDELMLIAEGWLLAFEENVSLLDADEITDDWKLAAALYARQAVFFAKGCMSIWRTDVPTLTTDPLFRAMLEMYVNYMYLHKTKEEGFRNLMSEALQDELKALADGGLLFLSESEKSQRRSEIEKHLEELKMVGACKLDIKKKSLEVWGNSSNRVYEYYRTLSAVSHGRVTWFFRTFGEQGSLKLRPNGDANDQREHLVLACKMLQDVLIGLALIEPRLLEA